MNKVEARVEVSRSKYGTKQNEKGEFYHLVEVRSLSNRLDWAGRPEVDIIPVPIPVDKTATFIHSFLAAKGHIWRGFLYQPGPGTPDKCGTPGCIACDPNHYQQFMARSKIHFFTDLPKHIVDGVFVGIDQQCPISKPFSKTVV